MAWLVYGYHEQITAGDSDSADTREGFKDVLQSSGGKCQYFLRRVDGYTLLDHLKIRIKTQIKRKRLLLRW